MAHASEAHAVAQFTESCDGHIRDTQLGECVNLPAHEIDNLAIAEGGAAPHR
jgi:hypothetical protein